SSDLVLAFGSEGCRYVSPSVIRLTGRTEAELLGGGVFAAVHDDDRTQVHTASQAGEPPEVVFRLLDRSGAWRSVEAHVSDLRQDRQVRCIVFNARDVTERLELEEQLRRQAFH